MSLFIVRYHEIGLKGNNRSFFESCLKENLNKALADVGPSLFRVRKKRDHFQVSCDDSIAPMVQDRLRDVMGVAHFCPVVSAKPEWEDVYQKAEELLKVEIERIMGLEGDFKTIPFGPLPFRVSAHRSNKLFPQTSMEMAQAISRHLLNQFPVLKVNLKHPKVTFYVDWGREEVHLYCSKIPGPGGLPVGSSGKVLALISSGFDSPVASWMMMRRGAKVAFVHFHSYPATSQDSIDHVEGLVKVLTRYQFDAKLYLIPLLDYQKKVMVAAPSELRTLLYRRMMLRLAERVLFREKAKAFVTGDSLAQVASQTLDNLYAVEVVAHRPMLRPLIGIDKREIIDWAHRIGTAELSSQPDEDCCSLYASPRPQIFASVEELEKAEAELEVPFFMDKLWAERRVVKF